MQYHAHTARIRLHDHVDVRAEFVDKCRPGRVSEHEVRAGTDVESSDVQARHGGEPMHNVAAGLLGRMRPRHGHGSKTI